MSGVILEDVLPASSFVSFSAEKLCRPDFVWCNQFEIPKEQLCHYAYYVPLPDDPVGVSQPNNAKIFFAERYGGAGVGNNGGGARCGLSGNVQVKGIGKNPLAGSATSFWHSYGGESLSGGIREAIWGEVCHSALPYSGARVHGLIRTGSLVPTFPSRETQNNMGTPRCLTVREAVVRPGHYVRSIYFSRQDEGRNSMVSDAERTKAAAASFFRITKEQERQSPKKNVSDELTEMARRFAAQHAAATAKRLVHGLHSPSNMCMDGRWIDFGTASSVSDYGRIITAKNGQDFWQNHKITEVIEDLVYALNKYGPVAASASIISARELILEFRTYLKSYMQFEFAKLTGIPASILKKIDTRIKENLFLCFSKIVSSGNSEPFKLFPPCVSMRASMPEKMGDFSLNLLLRLLSLCKNKNESERLISHELPNDSLRNELLSTYWALREAYSSCHGSLSDEYATQFLMLNSLRVNQANPALYRHQLDRRIDLLIEEEDNCEKFINDVVGKAAVSLAEPELEVIDLSPWFSSTAIVSEFNGANNNNNKTSLHDMLYFFELSTSSEIEKCKIAEKITQAF